MTATQVKPSPDGVPGAVSDRPWEEIVPFLQRHLQGA